MEIVGSIIMHCGLCNKSTKHLRVKNGDFFLLMCSELHGGKTTDVTALVRERLNATELGAQLCLDFGVRGGDLQQSS